MPRESHGHRSLAEDSPSDCKESDTTEHAYRMGTGNNILKIIEGSKVVKRRPETFRYLRTLISKHVHTLKPPGELQKLPAPRYCDLFSLEYTLRLRVLQVILM